MKHSSFAVLIAFAALAAIAFSQTIVPGGTITIPPATVLRAGEVYVYVDEGMEFQPPAGHQLEFLALATWDQDPEAPSSSTPAELRIFLEQKTDLASSDWVTQASRNHTRQPATANPPEQNEVRFQSNSQTPIVGSAKYPAVVRVLDRSSNPAAVSVRLIGKLTRCAL